MHLLCLEKNKHITKKDRQFAAKNIFICTSRKVIIYHHACCTHNLISMIKLKIHLSRVQDYFILMKLLLFKFQHVDIVAHARSQCIINHHYMIAIRCLRWWVIGQYCSAGYREEWDLDSICVVGWMGEL